jgi:hypothetical protein
LYCIEEIPKYRSKSQKTTRNRDCSKRKQNAFQKSFRPDPRHPEGYVRLCSDDVPFDFSVSSFNGTRGTLPNSSKFIDQQIALKSLRQYVSRIVANAALLLFVMAKCVSSTSPNESFLVKRIGTNQNACHHQLLCAIIQLLLISININHAVHFTHSCSLLHRYGTCNC